MNIKEYQRISKNTNEYQRIQKKIEIQILTNINTFYKIVPISPSIT